VDVHGQETHSVSDAILESLNLDWPLQMLPLWTKAKNEGHGRLFRVFVVVAKGNIAKLLVAVAACFRRSHLRVP
jgi:hypothetical protein